MDNLSPEDMVDPGVYEKPTVVKQKPQGDEIPDYFVFYLERDCLGKIANLHMALCDQYGRDGPRYPDCLQLAKAQSIAVDFAKHGESVPPEMLRGIRETQDRWPDFFEKVNEEMRISDGVLGVLYRDISND